MHYYLFHLKKTHKNEVLSSCSHEHIEYLLSLVEEIQHLKQHHSLTMSEVHSYYEWGTKQYNKTNADYSHACKKPDLFQH